MKNQDIFDAGFTAGYARGIDAKPRNCRAPMELILLDPDLIPAYGAAYDQGFAKGKADLRALEQWRAQAIAAECENESKEPHHER